MSYNQQLTCKWGNSHHGKSAYCSNDASMEGVTEQGTVLQTRVVDSSDVIDYASHIEPDQVKVRSKGTIQYKAGVPQKASGSSSFSILTEVCTILT